MGFVHGADWFQSMEASFVHGSDQVSERSKGQKAELASFPGLPHSG